MNPIFPSRYSGIPSSLCQKIDSLVNYFEKPLPSFKFSFKDLSEINEILSQYLQEHNSKAQKLIQITQTFQQLIENYSKSLSNLESFKVESEFKIEELESKIEILLKSEEDYEKRLESLNSYIETLEKNQDFVISERNSLKNDLIQTKTNAKLYQSRLETELNEERSNLLNLKLVSSKKLEKLKKELFIKEKTLKDHEEKIEIFQKKAKIQKDMHESLREECNKLKNDLFEMKNKLSENKLKKDNYKELYKELISFNSNKNTRNIAVQTSEEACESWTCEENNDLLELEEEQSLALSLNTFNIELADESSDMLQVSRKENTIYLIACKSEEKLKTETFSMFFPSRPKFLKISKQESFKINPVNNWTLASQTSKVQSCFSPNTLKNRSFKTAVFGNDSSRLEIIENFSSSNRRKFFTRFKMETWTSSIQVSKKITGNIDDDEKDLLKNDVETASGFCFSDTLKNNVMQFCPSLKSCCPIPYKPFNNAPNFSPLNGWSETLNIFIQDRLNLLRDP